MAKEKKNSAKNEIKDEKKAKKGKNTQAVEKDGKGHQVTFDTPSERLVHQVLPFVFIVLAILLEACFVFAMITGEEHVGIAGVVLKDIFLGLFGFCAFVIPVMMVNLAANWRKFVDSNVVTSKVVFTILFLISLSGLIHIFIK